ncbi:hypothetical protein [Nocardia aurea]|uniref:DUF4760 domain-containing protein n=1 Tax=Nocardia aurea TaxID=2144174 RepID=A0ABV3FWE7_9NOCA
MTTAMVAALTAVLGVVIGRLWDNRSESSRWRRDQKTASYQGFIEEFQSVCEVMRALATVDPGGAGSYAERVEHVRIDDFKGWDSAFNAVRLHGSTRVVDVATQLDLEITDLFYQVAEHQLSVDGWKQARVPARQAFDRFVVAARDELR